MKVTFDPQGIAKQMAVCEAAAEMPWSYVDNGFDGYIKSASGEYLIGGEPCEGRIEPDDPNAAFIVAASTAYPAALTEILRLQSEAAELREQVAKLQAERDAVNPKEVEA